MTFDESERFLRDLFDRAVASAMPGLVVREHIPRPPTGRTIAVGAGKASAAMAEALIGAWPGHAPLSGLVITRYGHVPKELRNNGRITIAEARHPIPDEAGVTATRQMLGMLGGLTENDLVIVLMSGGASALLVAPAGEITLTEKQALTAELIASGAPISSINTVRKHLSDVKAGRLAAAAFPAPVLALMISDVPGDDLGLIGSGPTVGDVTTAADAMAILSRWNISIAPSVRQYLEGPNRTIAPGDKRLSKVTNHLIATPSKSLAEAAAFARKQQLDVRILSDDLEGEARDVAAEHAQLALSIQRAMTNGSRPVLLLSGGELTVTRTGTGVGGPNAEYCLALAIALNGAPAVYFLAGDTDGVDGAAEVAGAVCGPDILLLARKRGVDPAAALRNNDAHTFFDICDAQLVTGPTLTNVNDFRAILIQPTR